MPRPNDSPDVAASKTLAYILRHGAEKEGLHIRSDGLVKLADVLARPKVKNLSIDEAVIFRLVEENAKKRFELVYGFDPSAPKPKKKKMQQPKKKGKGGAPAGAAAPGSTPAPGSDAVAALSADLAKAAVSPPQPAPEDDWKELDFVKVAPPAEGTGPSEPRAEWFIRATQGHSIKLEGTGHLTPVGDDADSRARAGLMVHGTQWRLWETLKSTGLSRMNRQHVHLAPALEGRIVPRNNSSLLIFLDLDKMLAATPPIPVFVAANGVVLTSGDAAGIVPPEYWRKAVHVDKGTRTVVWENGKEVERTEAPEEVGQLAYRGGTRRQ